MRADYDLGVAISYGDALERVTLGVQAVGRFAEVQDLPETKLFLTALLLGDRWKRRG